MSEEAENPRVTPGAWRFPSSRPEPCQETQGVHYMDSNQLLGQFSYRPPDNDPKQEG